MSNECAAKIGEIPIMIDKPEILFELSRQMPNPIVQMPKKLSSNIKDNLN